jgi:hypothetical protein
MNKLITSAIFALLFSATSAYSSEDVPDTTPDYTYSSTQNDYGAYVAPKNDYGSWGEKNDYGSMVDPKDSSN